MQINRPQEAKELFRCVIPAAKRGDSAPLHRSNGSQVLIGVDDPDRDMFVYRGKASAK
jgi:hypothetical protein